MSTRQKLRQLRARMREAGVSAYFIPSSDPHQSEYVPDCWKRRSWISGFSGSAGDVVVTLNKAGLWTDGRYFLQAEEDLAGSGMRLYRMGETGVPTIEQFLTAELNKGDVLGYDPQVVNLHRATALAAAASTADATMEPVSPNLVDAIWADQPPVSKQPVMLLGTEFAGESTAIKLRRVRKAMKAEGATALLVTTLDAIAWLFNIRGTDVDYNPVVLAYAIVTLDGAELFIESSKLDDRSKRQLMRSATLRPYGRVETACRRLAKKRERVWIDPATANAWCAAALGNAVAVAAPTPIDRMKAVKNETELAGIRAAHLRDGVAVTRFLCWLEEAVPSGEVTEMSAASKLEQFRARGKHFQGLSFPTIAGYAHHGAIIHYSVDESSDIPLQQKGLFLVDSGAQYLDGTTDITRTILLGEQASRTEQDRYTRVLKGHIAIATQRFPRGIPGARLDTLARAALWNAGLDYGHGTGHGVGAYLNVHEGPQSISFGRGLGAPLEPGNIQSNEPGYYEPGKFGIRIENLVEVVEDDAAEGFLRFNTLTRCPIDTRLVARNLLTDAEASWLNAYHKKVRQELTPLLGAKEQRWLKSACKRI